MHQALGFDGWCALHIAVAQLNAEMIELLVRHHTTKYGKMLSPVDVSTGWFPAHVLVHAAGTALLVLRCTASSSMLCDVILCVHLTSKRH